MLEEELRKETEKWLEKLKASILDLRGEKRFVENIKAYASDAEYFLEKSDLIRAFECIVWAWAWFEIGIEVGKIEARATHAGKQEDR